MADFTVKFHDAAIRPPRGGWHFIIGGKHVERFSETDITEAIAQWRRNNATFTSYDDIRRELWTYYCSQEPHRCGQITQPGDAPVRLLTAQVVSRDLKPEVCGPWIWQLLNLVGARWIPPIHDWFLSYIDMISVLIDCPKCQEEWRHIVATKNPLGLSSRLQVCQWINWAHNQVNAVNGKPDYSYERMVVEYGAPPP